MEHTNKIAIKLLRNRYSDYNENKWHYDTDYKMITEAIEECNKQEKQINAKEQTPHKAISVIVCKNNGFICGMFFNGVDFFREY